MKVRGNVRGGRSGWQPNSCLAVALFFAVVVTFSGALRNGFIGYDDPLYVTKNPHVMKGLNWNGISWAFSSTVAANWHPMTLLSHLLDVELFGLKPWGHHLTSIVLHGLNTVLLLIVLVELKCSRGKAFFVAALFGIHPLRVESVAWISERKDLLSGLFWMLSLWMYCRYARLARANERGVRLPEERRKFLRPRLTFYFFALAFFIMGLMSKPMVVTLPFVLLLLDYWPLKRFQRLVPNQRPVYSLVVEKLPFFTLSLLGCWVTLIVQKSGNAIITEASLPARLGNAVVSYVRYLRRIFWPTDLAAFYPSINAWPIGLVLFSTLCVGLITLTAILTRKAKPWLLVGWFWFLGVLGPVMGLIQAGEQSIADRYTYLPSIGITLICVWATYEVIWKWLNWRHKPLQMLRGLLVILLVSSAIVTNHQVRYWKDTKTLFAHAIAVTKNNYLAYNNLGVAYEQEGNIAEAVRQFEFSLQAKPDYPEAHNNLGIVLEKSGRFDESIAHLKAALRRRPNFAEAYRALGTVLEKVGRNAEAVQSYERALQLDPDDADAHNNLGAAYGRAGRSTEAIVEFRKVLELQPNSADAHNNLGVALDSYGRLNEAIDHFQEAIRLKPAYARAHFNLGGALSRKGDLDGAILEFREALKIQPEYPAAITNLHLLLEFKRAKGVR